MMGTRDLPTSRSLSATPCAGDTEPRTALRRAAESPLLNAMSLRWIFCTSFLLASVACGGGQKPERAADTAVPELSTAPTASASSGPEAKASSPRAKQTGLILDAMKEPDMGGYWYARMVAVGFTETGDYKLAGSWKKAFAALAGDKLDPSQCERILEATIREPDIAPAAEKRCGKLDALGKRITAGKDDAVKIAAATTACKIDGVKGSGENTAWAVVTAALVEDELAAQPETTADEKALAQRIRGLCLMPK